MLTAEKPSVPSGNVVLDELLGADIIWAGDHDYYGAEAAIESARDALTADGHIPYRMPIGGASTVGALGYVTAAIELRDELPELGTVVVADGSGGTHAGLVAGLGNHERVLGVDVGTRPDLLERVPEKAAAAATLADLPAPTGTVQLDVERFGAGYGALTADAREAIDLAARCEGLLLDPVYTAKAMAGLLAGIREGRIVTDAPVVFLHTGGLPAVFAAGVPEWLRAGEGADR